MVLVGVQPRLIQVPPSSRRSISAVFFPAATSAPAKGLPPCPEPMMMASKLSAIAALMSNDLNAVSQELDAGESEMSLYQREMRKKPPPTATRSSHRASTPSGTIGASRR